MSGDRTEHRAGFIDSLTEFAKEHRAQHWQGTFREFLESVVVDRADLLVLSANWQKTI